MKTLIVMRHAKTEEHHPDGDHERSLTKRGERNAGQAAQSLADQGLKPEVILSSTAARAVETARIVAAAFEGEFVQLQDERLYLAGADDILSTVQEFDEGIDVVLLIGHNPGLLDFINLFTGVEMERDTLPTSAYVVIEFETGSWTNILHEIARVSPLITP